MTWHQAGIPIYALAIFCDTAHVVSPMVLAWSHPGLRRIALSRPTDSIVLPIGVTIGAFLAPLVVVWWVYWAWNIYHFGAQHYGVSRIFGLRVPKWLCVGGTAILMAGVPWLIHPEWWPWFALVALDFNHWLVDIGLSSRVFKRWWLFILSLIPLGCAGFLFEVPRADTIVMPFVPWIIKARWGVGIAHFLYSSWVWKLSDPQVGATIGKELFGAKAIRP
jgi:hypothetical protein